MALKRISEGKVKVDAFSIFLSLRITFLSYNLARNHFMYVEEEKFYTRSPTCKENIRFKRVRVRCDIAPEVDRSTHRQSGNQVTTPNDISLPFCYHSLVNAKLQNEVRSPSWRMN